LPSAAGLDRQTLDEAYRECERIARRHYENFPVASLAIPGRFRRHVAAIYAFARSADDFADEAGVADRLGRLDEWERSLGESVAGNARPLVFQALGHTIRTCGLPMHPFADLLDAFRIDVTTKRHRTFEDLLAYSRKSANPVGRLLLALFGYRDEELARQADCICTALQLTNFWQDIRVDWEKDRVYIPEEEMQRAGYTESDLANQVVDDRFRGLMAGLVRRTRDLFERGRPLGARLGGRFGLEVRMIWLGGTRILERVETVGYDVFRRRPQLRRRDRIAILARALRGEPVMMP